MKAKKCKDCLTHDEAAYCLRYMLFGLESIDKAIKRLDAWAKKPRKVRSKDAT